MYTDGDYGVKLTESLTPLLNCKTIDEFYGTIGLTKLPMLPRGSEEDTKAARDKLKASLDELKETVSNYGNKETILDSLNSIKDYSSVIIDIVKDYLYSFHKYKEDNGIYDFQDIALLSIRVLKENESVRNELRDTFKEIMIDEYQDTNKSQNETNGLQSPQKEQEVIFL